MITLKLLREDISRFSNTSKDLTNDSLFQLAIHKVSDDFRLPQRVSLFQLNDIFVKKLPIKWVLGQKTKYEKIYTSVTISVFSDIK